MLDQETHNKDVLLWRREGLLRHHPNTSQIFKRINNIRDPIYTWYYPVSLTFTCSDREVYLRNFIKSIDFNKVVLAFPSSNFIQYHLQIKPSKIFTLVLLLYIFNFRFKKKISNLIKTYYMKHFLKIIIHLKKNYINIIIIILIFFNYNMRNF